MKFLSFSAVADGVKIEIKVKNIIMALDSHRSAKQTNVEKSTGYAQRASVPNLLKYLLFYNFKNSASPVPIIATFDNAEELIEHLENPHPGEN